MRDDDRLGAFFVVVMAAVIIMPAVVIMSAICAVIVVVVIIIMRFMDRFFRFVGMPVVAVIIMGIGLPGTCRFSSVGMAMRFRVVMCVPVRLDGSRCRGLMIAMVVMSVVAVIVTRTCKSVGACDERNERVDKKCFSKKVHYLAVVEREGIEGYWLSVWKIRSSAAC